MVTFYPFFHEPCLHCAVHGVEYAFGAHDYPTSGVFEVEPRQCPGFKFRKSIFIGTTCLDPAQVREFMECQAAECSVASESQVMTRIIRKETDACQEEDAS